jgi:hypothetical protein
MTALTEDRAVREALGRDYSSTVKASTTIYAGGMIGQDTAGDAVMMSADNTLRVLGVAMEQVDNSAGGDGDLSVTYRKGIFLMNNQSGDLCTIAEKGEACFAQDDNTVAKTNNGGARPMAGKIIGFEGTQVMVEIGSWLDIDGDLVAANNLSDVAAAATARANIGANLVALQFTERASLDDAATTLRIVAPVAGTIEDFQSVLSGVITGGDPTLTLSINGTPVTTGVITITAAGSAAGDVDSASPSAAKTIAVDDVIECAVAANSQSNDEYADIVLRIET